MNEAKSIAYESLRIAAAALALVGVQPWLRKLGLPTVVTFLAAAIVSSVLVVLVTELAFARTIVSITWKEAATSRIAARPSLHMSYSSQSEIMDRYTIEVSVQGKSILSRIVTRRLGAAGSHLRLSFKPQGALFLTKETATSQGRTRVTNEYLEFDLSGNTTAGPWTWVTVSFEPGTTPQELDVAVVNELRLTGPAAWAVRLLSSVRSIVNTIVVREV